MKREWNIKTGYVKQKNKEGFFSVSKKYAGWAVKLEVLNKPIFNLKVKGHNAIPYEIAKKRTYYVGKRGDIRFPTSMIGARIRLYYEYET